MTSMAAPEMDISQIKQLTVPPENSIAPDNDTSKFLEIDKNELMKFVEPSHFTDPDAAARKLVEIANAVEAVQDGRIYIERPFP